MTEERIELTCTGPPRLASVLAQMLREEGLTVTYTPPREGRGLAADAHEVAVLLVASGAGGLLKAGVERALTKFRAKFPAGSVKGRHAK